MDEAAVESITSAAGDGGEAQVFINDETQRLDGGASDGGSASGHGTIGREDFGQWSDELRRLAIPMVRTVVTTTQVQIPGAQAVEPPTVVGSARYPEVTDWTLGSTRLSSETGGSGGKLESYLRDSDFSASTPPDNNACAGAEVIDVTNADTAVALSGTTEDLMGKNLASDSHNAANCVAEGGPDVYDYAA